MDPRLRNQPPAKQATTAQSAPQHSKSHTTKPDEKKDVEMTEQQIQARKI